MFARNQVMKRKPSEGELLRDYLHRYLYDQEVGFFSRLPLLEAPKQSFNGFKSRADYDQTYERIVKQQGGKFVTPSELFRPWYGASVARWAMTQHRLMEKNQPLRIYEVGAGNGSTAEDCLVYLQRHHPDVYESCVYTVIEVSYAMANTQKMRLAGFMDEGRAELFRGSIMDWENLVEDPCCVVALEVLDNMPHDKVVLMQDSVFQTHVVIDVNGNSKFEIVPIEDEKILRALYYWRAKKGYKDPSSFTPTFCMKWLIGKFRNFMPLGDGEYFVPSVGVDFLHKLAHRFPQHSLLLSDFEFLPRCIPGTNGPLVQSYKPQRVHMCISDAPMYECDVVFPTDFSCLMGAYEDVCLKRSRVSTHMQFVDEHGFPENTKLTDGSNPMRETYENVIYFTSCFKDVIEDPEPIEPGETVHKEQEKIQQ
ncbi:hypothetical protein NDN08_002484 [Rhodosorus marinus]|uniref:Protein arginine methyltransferase NDUFAF7 n=1 Tax=Rhodosorus marinus TaxID=101924 RepID=A0AAV8UWL3_9RHOD|nr:hypothetical protein NDN08_002484 [Rhodosorus marinus]